MPSVRSSNDKEIARRERNDRSYNKIANYCLLGKDFQNRAHRVNYVDDAYRFVN